MEWTPRSLKTRSTPKAAGGELLRQELRKVGPRTSASPSAPRPILTSPPSAVFDRTRAILEVFARERGRYLGITTKSDLVVRDLDLLWEIADANVISVATSRSRRSTPRWLARLSWSPRAHAAESAGSGAHAQPGGHPRQRDAQPDHAGPER